MVLTGGKAPVRSIRRVDLGHPEHNGCPLVNRSSFVQKSRCAGRTGLNKVSLLPHFLLASEATSEVFFLALPGTVGGVGPLSPFTTQNARSCRVPRAKRAHHIFTSAKRAHHIFTVFLSLNSRVSRIHTFKLTKGHTKRGHEPDFWPRTRFESKEPCWQGIFSQAFGTVT